MIKIYHHPTCSKSGACLLFLENSGNAFETINYLETAPTFSELSDIINKLGIPPIEVVRKNEPLWIEKYEGKNMTDDEIIEAMVTNPILIERPIVVNGDKAVIARPLEKAASIL